MKSIIKKTLLAIVLVIITAVAAFVTIVGPWPTYGESAIAEAGYYKRAEAAVDASLGEQPEGQEVEPLRAGWARVVLTPEVGIPLAGFGDRKGAPSTGVHDDLYVKALALSDGHDTAVIVGSDMLLVPETVSEIVRKDVCEQTGLRESDILFNASHSHSGPGAWGPGFLANQFAGEFDENVVKTLAERFSEAIRAAYADLKPAKLGHGSTDASEFIRNRTRDAATDGNLDFLVVEQTDGARCHVVRFSAHATMLGGSNMEFSGDYPGYLQRVIEEETGGFAMFLAGAVGSMSGCPPEGTKGFAKAEGLGAALAHRVLEASDDIQLDESVDVTAVGAGFTFPPMQLRINKSWRVSPFLLRIAGIDTDGWVEGVRLDDLFIYGTPADFSGELSVEFREWAEGEGTTLWVTSFNGDYAGYVSPGRYYETADPKGDESYEMYIMSWLGPNQEAFFRALMEHMVETTASRVKDAA